MIRPFVQLALLPAKLALDVVFSMPEEDVEDPLVWEDENTLGYRMGHEAPAYEVSIMYRPTERVLVGVADQPCRPYRGHYC